MIWCGSTEIFLEPTAVHQSHRGLREGPREERPRHRAFADLRLRRAQGRRALRQRRAEPHRRHSGDDRALEEERRADLRQGLQDRPDVHEDRARAGLQGAHARRQRLVLHQHPRQPRRRSARRSAVVQDQGRVEARLARIHLPARALSRSLQATSTTRFASTTTRRAATKKKPGTTSTSSAGSAIPCRSRSTSSAATRFWPRPSRSTWCCSSTWPSARRSCAPSAFRSGSASTSSRRRRAEGLYPEHDLFIQSMKLKNTLRHIMGADLITHLGLEYYD